MCRVCGSRHSLSEPHRFKTATGGAVEVVVGKTVPVNHPKNPSNAPRSGAEEDAAQVEFVGTAAKATLERVAKAEKADACPELHGQKDKPGIVVGYNFKAAEACPVCAERRAKQKAATKRYREKQKGAK